MSSPQGFHLCQHAMELEDTGLCFCKMSGHMQNCSGYQEQCELDKEVEDGAKI